MTKKKEIPEFPTTTHAPPVVVELPTILYRCPGSRQRQGGTYTYEVAKTQDEHQSLIKKGFHITLPAAVEAYELDKKTVNK